SYEFRRAAREPTALEPEVKMLRIGEQLGVTDAGDEIVLCERRFPHDAEMAIEQPAEDLPAIAEIGMDVNPAPHVLAGLRCDRRHVLSNRRADRNQRVSLQTVGEPEECDLQAMRMRDKQRLAGRDAPLWA